MLAIGITDVEGSFDKGDVVDLCGPEGTQIARGLTNYSAVQMQKIKGCRSNQIAELLGHQPYDEVIHRDNLVVPEAGTEEP